MLKTVALSCFYFLPFQWVLLGPPPPPRLRTETGPVSETLCFLVLRIPNGAQSPETRWFYDRNDASLYPWIEPSGNETMSSSQGNRSDKCMKKPRCYGGDMIYQVRLWHQRLVMSNTAYIPTMCEVDSLSLKCYKKWPRFEKLRCADVSKAPNLLSRTENHDTAVTHRRDTSS
jgi:hypothetical protein